MTPDRQIHLLVGIITLAIVLALTKPEKPFATGLKLSPFMALGTWMPDWDLYVDGIGFHRNPIFHSIVPALVVGGIFWKYSKLIVPVGISIGVGSHLLWDIVFYGDVRWISGGNKDRLFLFVNGAALIVYSIASLHSGSKGKDQVWWV